MAEAGMEEEGSWGSGPPRGAADPPLAVAGGGGSPSLPTLGSGSALEEREEGAETSNPGGGGEAEEEGSVSSPYLEVLAPPGPRSTGTPPSPQVDPEPPVHSHPSPISRTSELDTSVDSGLTGESKEVGEEESAGDPRQPAPTDVGQPCQLSCPPDMGEDGTGAAPRGGRDLRDAHPLSLDLLLPVASYGHNAATGVTPDLSEHEVFFDLVCEAQSRRINDQRYSLRKRLWSQRECHSLPSSPVERIQFFFHSMTSLQTEELFDLIARSQSRRLDDQRVDFEGSPGGEGGPKVCGETLEYLDLVGPAGNPADNGPEATPCPPSTSDSTPPPAERGAPPAEESTAPAEREVPAEEGAAPAEKREPSPASGQVPAEEEETPADGERIPAEGEVPVEKGNAPAEEIPAEGEEIPAEGEENPADGEEIPKEAEKIPAGGEAPAEEGEAPAGPAEGEEAPAGREQNSVAGKGIKAGKKDPDEELYNTILMHQSARARIEDQRSNPPARSPRDFFDLLERLQERRMDEQRADPPPGLGADPKRGAGSPTDERRPSVFTPLLKGMSQRRANSN